MSVINGSGGGSRTTTRTQSAANAALREGMLHRDDVKRMTDGRVSLVDLQQARQMVASAQRSGDGDQLKIARELESAIKGQMGQQGGLSTLMETHRDSRAQVDNMLDRAQQQMAEARQRQQRDDIVRNMRS